MRIAVVGGGVSGLGAALILSRVHQVEIFEREPRAGGHAHTRSHDGLELDTGFLVHNTRNYPLLCRLFEELGVRTQDSEMSFSVSCRDCGLEYSGRRPFAQMKNVGKPHFHQLLWEIGRWLRTARRSLDETDYETTSLAAYLDAHRYSERFRSHFIVPLTSALWSTAPGRALEFPAAYAIRFFENHGMLGFGRLRWRTVTGGSRVYVNAIADRLGSALHVGIAVRGIRRTADGVELRTIGDELRTFDQVVIATHADEALALLEDPSPAEKDALGGFTYTVNDTVLHTDSSFLPHTHAARASWNYRTGDSDRPTLTYYLNKLQRLDTDRDYCITLNQEIPEEHVLARLSYTHPLYTVGTLRAQSAVRSLSGERRTWFAGAHLGNGFHEDGFASGVRAAAGLGVEW